MSWDGHPNTQFVARRIWIHRAQTTIIHCSTKHCPQPSTSLPSSLTINLDKCENWSHQNVAGHITFDSIFSFLHQKIVAFQPRWLLIHWLLSDSSSPTSPGRTALVPCATLPNLALAATTAVVLKFRFEALICFGRDIHLSRLMPNQTSSKRRITTMIHTSSTSAISMPGSIGHSTVFSAHKPNESNLHSPTPRVQS